MRTYKQKQSKKKIIAMLTSIFLLVALFTYAWFSPSVPFLGVKEAVDRPNNSTDYRVPTNDQIKASNEVKKDFVEERYGERAEEKSSISINISSAIQGESTLSIRTVIQNGNARGTCLLSLTHGDTLIRKEAPTQSMGSYVTCQGFDVSLSELASGDWRSVVIYTSESGVEHSAERMIHVSI